VLATARADTGLNAIQIYIDNQLKYQSGAGVQTVDQQFTLAAGSHYIVVKGWDKFGNFSSPVTVNVDAGGGGGTGGSCSATANRTVTICAPTAGSTVGSPVRVLAGLRSDTGISEAQIYLDNSLVWRGQTAAGVVDQNIAAGAGTHRITVKGWDKFGNFSSVVTISVSTANDGGGGTSCTASANRTVNICLPTNGSAVSSPVRVLAALRSDAGIAAAQIYLDNSLVWQGPAGTSLVDQTLTMGSGVRRITVKGWDSSGAFASAVSVTVQ
jgi:hypothetical protein